MHGAMNLLLCETLEQQLLVSIGRPGHVILELIKNCFTHDRKVFCKGVHKKRTWHSTYRSEAVGSLATISEPTPLSMSSSLIVLWLKISYISEQDSKRIASII